MNKALSKSTSYKPIIQLVPNAEGNMYFQLLPNQKTNQRTLNILDAGIREYIRKNKIEPKESPDRPPPGSIAFSTPERVNQEPSPEPVNLTPVYSNKTIAFRKFRSTLSILDQESLSDPEESSVGFLYYPADLPKAFDTDDIRTRLQEMQKNINEEKLEKACPVLQIIELDKQPFVQAILNRSATPEQYDLINKILIKYNQKAGSVPYNWMEDIDNEITDRLSKRYQPILENTEKEDLTVLSIRLSTKETSNSIQKKINECLNALKPVDAHDNRIPYRDITLSGNVVTNQNSHESDYAEILVKSPLSLKQDTLEEIKRLMTERLEKIEHTIKIPVPPMYDLLNPYSSYQSSAMIVDCHNHLEGLTYNKKRIPYCVKMTKGADGEEREMSLDITLDEKAINDINPDDRIAMLNILAERLKHFAIVAPQQVYKKSEYIELLDATTNQTNTDDDLPGYDLEEDFLEKELEKITNPNALPDHSPLPSIGEEDESLFEQDRMLNTPADSGVGTPTPPSPPPSTKIHDAIIDQKCPGINQGR